MNEFLISSASSVISSTIVYPIDLIKTQFQVNQINRATTLHNSVPSFIANIYRTQGFRGYFKGLIPHLGTYPFFWGTYFYMNQYQFEPFTGPYSNKVLNSFLSAGVASTVANPLFVLKTRLQTDILNANSTYIKYTDSVKRIITQEGTSGMFKGLGTTIGSNTKLAIQFPMYDLLKDYGYNTFYASLVAKTITSSLFYPMDLIRTNQRDSPNKLSAMDATRMIIKNRGFFGLYRGVLLYNAMTGPNFVLMMVIKDWLTRR